MAESVKAKVIALAKADPFLTVEELSERADTTTRYVRTILSEAGLSLNRLRRQYARRLERRLGDEAPDLRTPAPVELGVVQIRGAEVRSALVPWHAEDKLFQVSAVDFGAGLKSFVQLITPHSVTMHPDYIDLRRLLPCPTPAVGEQKVEILLGEHALNALLDLPAQARLLRLSSVLTAQGEIIALERRWFGLEGIALRWSKLEPELKVYLTG